MDFVLPSARAEAVAGDFVGGQDAHVLVCLIKLADNLPAFGLLFGVFRVQRARHHGVDRDEDARRDRRAGVAGDSEGGFDAHRGQRDRIAHEAGDGGGGPPVARDRLVETDGGCAFAAGNRAFLLSVQVAVQATKGWTDGVSPMLAAKRLQLVPLCVAFGKPSFRLKKNRARDADLAGNRRHGGGGQLVPARRGRRHDLQFLSLRDHVHAVDAAQLSHERRAGFYLLALVRRQHFWQVGHCEDRGVHPLCEVANGLVEDAMGNQRVQGGLQAGLIRATVAGTVTVGEGDGGEAEHPGMVIDDPGAAFQIGVGHTRPRVRLPEVRVGGVGGRFQRGAFQRRHWDKADNPLDIVQSQRFAHGLWRHDFVGNDQEVATAVDAGEQVGAVRVELQIKALVFLPHRIRVLRRVLNEPTSLKNGEGRRNIADACT